MGLIFFKLHNKVEGVLSGSTHYISLFLYFFEIVKFEQIVVFVPLSDTLLIRLFQRELLDLHFFESFIVEALEAFEGVLLLARISGGRL